MAPLYGEQRSSSVAGVHISAEQEKEISLILAEVSIQKIEQWVRIAGSLDPETKVVRGRVYGKDIPLIREGQKVHIYPLIARQPVLQGRVVRTFLDGKRSEEHTSELQSRRNYVCRLLLEKKKNSCIFSYIEI